MRYVCDLDREIWMFCTICTSTFEERDLYDLCDLIIGLHPMGSSVRSTITVNTVDLRTIHMLQWVGSV